MTTEEPAGLIAPAPASPAVIDFRQALFHQTPRAWVTPLLLAANVAVYAAMVMGGVDAMNPTSAALLRWGADFGPAISEGQVWRLLTNTFVHVGAFHLFMNMLGLWQIGLLVERLLGNAGYLVTYLLAGLAGSLTSMAIHPFTVSAGASGAIFGIYGALASYLVLQRGSVPRQALRALQTTAISFVAFNVIYGLRAKGIDMAAHTGGFVAGAVAGVAVASPLGRPSPRRGATAALTAAVGLALVLVAVKALPRTTDLSAEVAAFGPIEQRAVNTYQEAVTRAGQQGMDDLELARIIDEQVLPPWRAFQRRFAARKRVAPAQEEFVGEFTLYLTAREEAWTATVQALRRHDHAAVVNINRDLAAKLSGLQILKAEEKPKSDLSSAPRPPGDVPGDATSP